jgi:hypothetical protein
VSSGRTKEQKNKRTKEQKNKRTKEQKNKEPGALRANKEQKNKEQKNRVPSGRTKEQKNRGPSGRTKEQKNRGPSGRTTEPRTKRTGRGEEQENQELVAPWVNQEPKNTTSPAPAGANGYRLDEGHAGARNGESAVV